LRSLFFIERLGDTRSITVSSLLIEGLRVSTLGASLESGGFTSIEGLRGLTRLASSRSARASSLRIDAEEKRLYLFANSDGEMRLESPLD